MLPRQKNIKFKATSWNIKDPREELSVCSSLPKWEHWGTPFLAVSPNKRPCPDAATTCSPLLFQEPVMDPDVARANLHWHQGFCWLTCQPVCGNSPSPSPTAWTGVYQPWLPGLTEQCWAAKWETQENWQKKVVTAKRLSRERNSNICQWQPTSLRGGLRNS